MHTHLSKPIPIAALLLALVAVPATASAQRHGGHGRPVHVTTTPVHVTTVPVHAERYDLRSALRSVERLVDEAEDAARPFNESVSRDHVRRAEAALMDARGELGRFGSVHRFEAALSDAESYARQALRRVDALHAELERIRDDAHQELRRVSARTHRGSGATAYVASAEASVDAGDRAVRFANYTQARAFYADALSALDSARTTLAREERHDRWDNDHRWDNDRGRDDWGRGRGNGRGHVGATPVRWDDSDDCDTHRGGYF